MSLSPLLAGTASVASVAVSSVFHQSQRIVPPVRCGALLILESNLPGLPVSLGASPLDPAGGPADVLVTLRLDCWRGSGRLGLVLLLDLPQRSQRPVKGSLCTLEGEFINLKRPHVTCLYTSVTCLLALLGRANRSDLERGRILGLRF